MTEEKKTKYQGITRSFEPLWFREVQGSVYVGKDEKGNSIFEDDPSLPHKLMVGRNSKTVVMSKRQAVWVRDTISELIPLVWPEEKSKK